MGPVVVLSRVLLWYYNGSCHGFVIDPVMISLQVLPWLCHEFNEGFVTTDPVIIIFLHVWLWVMFINIVIMFMYEINLI